MTIAKLPDKISVFGQEFRIELVPDLKSGDDEVHGETSGIHHRIRISADLDLSRQWQTLVHEYVHAVLYVVGVSNVTDDTMEEVIAQSLEYGIWQLLQQHGVTLAKLTNGKK